jgi:cytidylate kinase
MNNFLEEYLRQKYLEATTAKKNAGPVVTISREFGCEAKAIARELADKLNTYYLGLDESKKWEIISKEVIEESARELQTDSKRIEYIFAFEKRPVLDDFFLSMTSGQYQSEWKVMQAVKNVVRAFAEKGHSIIIGRAGAQITGDIHDALHIKLIASFRWRVNHIKEKYGIIEREAVKKVRNMDENRQKLIEMFSKKADCEHCYDVFYNLERLSGEVIVSDIIHMMQMKKLI